MANGYLGKISALVTANTSDFQAKLSGSAQSVRDFAGQVQRNLAGAARDSARAFEAIYTPLQRFERSLQAAGSLKLSFKGFPGALKDLDALQQRMAGVLNDRQVSVILKTTGLESIDRVRERLKDLTSKDLQIVASVGGLEKLREIGAMAKADVDVTAAQQKLIETRQRAAELEAAIKNVGQQPVAVAVDSTQLVTLRERLAAAEKQATQLSGREYSRSGLNSAIDAEVAKLSEYSSAIERAKNVRASLATAAAGPRGDSAAVAAKDKEIAALEQEQKAVADHVNQLRALRSQIKEIRRSIAESERAPTATDDAGRSNQFKELESAQRAAARAARELQQVFQQKYGISIDLAGLEALIARADNAGEVINRVGELIEKFGESEFTAAADQARQMASATEAILKPLAAAQATVASLAAEVQGAFLPALASTQSEAESLVAMIKEGVAPASAIAAAFGGVRKSVEEATAAASRLKEVSDSVGRLKTGRELVFQQPQLVESLGNAAAVGNQAAELPASALRANPRIAESLIEVSRLARDAEVAYAKLQLKAAEGLSTRSSQREVDVLAQKLKQASETAENEIKVGVDISEADARLETLNKKITAIRQDTEFQFTGRIQNIDQAKQEFARIRSEASRTSGVREMTELEFPIRALGDLVATEDESKLKEIIGLVDILKSKLGDQVAFNLKTEESERDARRLAASLDELKARAAQAATGLVQNRAQAESALGNAVGRFGELTPDRQSRVSDAMNAAVGSLSGGGFDPALIRAFELLIAKELEAQQGAQRLREEMRKIAEGSNPSQPIELLKKNLEEARAAVAKLTGEQRKVGEQNIAKIEGFVGSARGSGREEEAVALAAQRAGEVRDEARAAAPEKQVRNPIGEAFGTAARDIDAVQSKVISLQNNIENLPTPLQAEFIPAINRVRDAFAKLTPTSTKAEIDAAAEEARKLGVEVDRAGAAAKRFGTTFKDAARESESKAAAARLQFLTNAILASGKSSDKAAASLENLRRAYGRVALSPGGFTDPGNKAAIADAEKQAVGAVAGATGKNANRLAEDMRRAGDVGRAGVDKWSLAANQAAFAIDDFLSSTGGFEFKLRAISNNITQLAFIVGGTKGLFIGLGAVLAGQAAVGLVKWINNGRTAEDQTKALNDALSRQKSLVDDLAKSFLSLGDATARGTRSAGADRGAEFGRSVSDIQRKQRESRENRILDLDPDVQRRRAERNKLEKQLETEQDPGRRVEIQESIRELDKTERRARATAGNGPVQLPGAQFETPGLMGMIERGQRLLGTAPPPTGGATIETPADVRSVLFDEALRNMPNRAGPGGRELSGDEKRARARSMADSAGDTLQSQREAIESLISQLRPVSEDTFLGMSTAPAARAAESIARLSSLLEQLESPLNKAIDDLSVKVASASEDAARSIRDAQEDVASAIERGVPGATAVQRRLDDLSAELSEANGRLARSAEMAQEEGDPAKRESLVKDAEKQVAGVRRQQAEVEEQARAARLGRTLGGERTSTALSGLEQSGAFQNERGGLVAVVREAVDAEMQARRNSERQAAQIADRQKQLQTAREDLRRVEDAGGDTTAAQAAVAKAEADLKAAKAAGDAAARQVDVAQASSELAAALAEAALAVEASLARIRKVGEGAKQRSEQGADAAQRSLEENPFRAGLSDSRDAAEARLIDDRAAVDQAQARLSNRRREVQSDPRVLAITGEMELLNQRRQELEAKSRIEGGLSPAERAELDSAIQREIELRRQLDQTVRGLTEAERKQLDAINRSIAAREREIEKNRKRAEEDPTFTRERGRAGQVIEEGERQANEARQRYIENPTFENFRRSQEADSRAREDRARGQGLEDALDNKRKEIEQSPAIRVIDQQMAARNEELAKLAEIEANRPLTAAEKKRRDDLQAANRSDAASREDAIAAGTAPERAAIDAAQMEQSQRERARRGRELAMTERERFRKEMLEGPAGELNAAAAEMRKQGQDPTAMLRQGLKNQMESVAPMLQQFQDARENALFQGPSRAALNVSDVSTSQGAAELSRLIRGDDSAKDVNLAELRKQTQKFDELIKAVQAANPGVLL